MSFITEVRDRLVAEGVGVFGATLFIGSAARIPSLSQGGAGPFVSLRETGGTRPVRTQNDTGVQRPGAQVLVRAQDPTIARTKIVQAYNALGGANGLYNITLSGIFYISLTIRQEPSDIGLDEEKRIMFSFNIDAEKYPS